MATARKPASYATSFGVEPGAAIAHLRRADKSLARVIDRVGPFRMELKHTASIYGALTEAIVNQQLSGKAAATIFARVCALFPRTVGAPSERQILRISAEKLRGAGLSQAKTLSLRDLARRTLAGQIPTLKEMEGMDDEAIIEHLVAVRGIGRWTAEMLLMFRLGRPDVLPVDDLGIRQGYAYTMRQPAMPDRARVRNRGERWRPYRTVASWYLWRAAELRKYTKKGK